jgi:26S proteasome regulatory subunit N7
VSVDESSEVWQDKAIEAYEAAIAKTAGLASRIDLRLSIVRVHFFHGNLKAVAAAIATAKALIDQGGDWDRRNRCKVYQGLHAIAVRDFKLGATLFLDTLSTFTALELIDYTDFVALCVIAGTFACDRKDLKKKVRFSVGGYIVKTHFPRVDPRIARSHRINAGAAAPQRLHRLPLQLQLLALLHRIRCVRTLFPRPTLTKVAAEVEEHHLQTSNLLAIHTRFYVREMRIKAYAQFLESYRSVTLSSLGHAFGVSEDFVDGDLARFIASGRLAYAIDKVNGVVETTSRSVDPRNLKYEQVIQRSDALLNNIQRLSRVVG